MKTLEQLKELASRCLDGRDFNRLAKFIPYNMIKDFGMEPNEEYNNEERWNSTVVEFTRENVLKQLEEDVRFGFEKALNQRGISASLMFECDALFDIDGRGNTERLVARNPKLKNLLEDGEYIPSLRQLNLMAHYKDSINDALEYIGAKPLGSVWYWPSTEHSQDIAWGMLLSNGYTGKGGKHISNRVREVIDF